MKNLLLFLCLIISPLYVFGKDLAHSNLSWNGHSIGKVVLTNDICKESIKSDVIEWVAYYHKKGQKIKGCYYGNTTSVVIDWSDGGHNEMYTNQFPDMDLDTANYIYDKTLLGKPPK